MVTMAEVVVALRVKQGSMTAKEFAAMLEIDESALCRIYSGERQIGEVIGRRLVRAYPDLVWLVTAYLMSKPETGE